MSLKLHVLGTGNAGALKIYNTCFCIENKGKFFLVDAGGGNQINAQLKNAGIAIENIRDIFLSHNHIDHIMGMVWVMRQIFILRREGKYKGDCNIYAMKEGIRALTMFREVVFGKTDYDTTKGINFVEVKNGSEIDICGMSLKFFDVKSEKDKQFGFSMNDNFLVFVGDDPLRKPLFPRFKDCTWLLHEAFCLESEKQLYNPHPKGHCTVLEAAQTAKEINAKNLVLWHTKDNRDTAKYTNEAKQAFTGNIFVPNDLDVIELGRIRAIVLDIDGVIVGEKNGFNSPDPHPEVIAKMREVTQRGIKIILCTAKPHFAIQGIINDVGLSNPHITDGGGVLIDPTKNDIIKKHIIDPKQAKFVISACLKKGVYTEVYTTENYIIQKSQINDITPQHTHILQAEPKIVSDLVSLDDEITKIMPVVNGEKEKTEFTQFFNSLGSDLILTWGVHPIALPLQFGIITAKGISKKEGAIAILKKLGIDPSEALGVGDSTGDWSYIEMCNYGATLENGTEDLKRLVSSKGKTSFIAPHVDQNGANKILDWAMGVTG
ncbi:MAG: HAD hydrolase family protein [Firmicutes bacterium]|nr:HAD hydrolase family protein [Bacillota bacterium]